MSPTPSPLDDRLRAAVETVIDRHDPDDVIAAVHQRREHRRRTARVRRPGTTAVALAAAAVVAAVMAGALMGTTGRSDLVAGPASRPSASSSNTAERPGTAERVDVPGTGDLTAVLATVRDGFWLASSSPNAITRVGVDGVIGPTTPLVGSPILAAADDSSLWVLVDEADGSDRPYRLKRIDTAGGDLVSSVQVRLDGRPVALARVDGQTVIATDRTELVVDESGAALERPLTSAARRTTSGDVEWSLDGEVLTSTAPGERAASATVPGARRLAPAPSAAPGAILLERATGDRTAVELRTSADGPSIAVAEIDATANTAAVTSDAVWFLDRGSLRRLAR